MPIARSHRRVLAVTMLLCLGGAAAKDVVVPTELRPDASLPDIRLDVDLGERGYDLSEERRNGEEVIAFYNKEMGLVHDPVLQHRVELMGHRVITSAMGLGPRQVRLDKPADAKKSDELTFTFRILDSDEINAFSAWGGNIYVTRAMIEFCQSDDELAGILGHEVAHTMFHHLREQVRKVQRYNTQQILALIAAAFMGLNVAHVAGIVQWVHLALLNGHSVEDEAQADYAGCFYTYRAGYNPVGMITCFERLFRLYRSRPNAVDLGAFQTHPWSDERAASLEKQIRALGLPVDRRAVTNALTAGVRATPGGEGQPATVELMLGDVPLMTVVAGIAKATPEDRAADAALAINRALSRGLRATDLRLVRTENGWLIRSLAKLRPLDLMEIREPDAAAAAVPIDTFATTVYRRFVARCRQEQINTGAL